MVRYRLATERQKELAAKARDIMEEFLTPQIDKLEKGGAASAFIPSTCI